MERTLQPRFASELKTFLDCIHVRYSYDFRQYAPESVKRTVIHAMNRMGLSTLKSLQEKVLDDSASFDELIQSLTISVSELFRDPSYFLSMKDDVFPYLNTYASIKIWVAGCSTGEEVYSFAILLKEAGLLERTTIYATDINSRSITKAKAGLFPLSDMDKAHVGYQNAGGQRSLSEYYTTSVSSVKFDETLVKNVTFSNHSLVTDTVFSETHLISCRNVLIYFNRELQDRALNLFAESLCRKGFLGLGSKETMQFSKCGDYFKSFVKKDRIFQKI